MLKLFSKPFTALAGKAHHAVEQKILLSVFRHLATGIGTLLMSSGYLDMEQFETFVGAVVVLLSVGAGIAQKWVEASAKA